MYNFERTKWSICVVLFVVFVLDSGAFVTSAVGHDFNIDLRSIYTNYQKFENSGISPNIVILILCPVECLYGFGTIGIVSHKSTRFM